MIGTVGQGGVRSRIMVRICAGYGGCCSTSQQGRANGFYARYQARTKLKSTILAHRHQRYARDQKRANNTDFVLEKEFASNIVDSTEHLYLSIARNTLNLPV